MTPSYDACAVRLDRSYACVCHALCSNLWLGRPIALVGSNAVYVSGNICLPCAMTWFDVIGYAKGKHICNVAMHATQSSEYQTYAKDIGLTSGLVGMLWENRCATDNTDGLCYDRLICMCVVMYARQY